MFEKQAKKLIKKYPSLKNELLELINELKVLWAKIVSRSELLFLRREKEKVEEEELLPILLSQVTQSFCSPFMINLNKKTFQKKN